MHAYLKKIIQDERWNGCVKNSKKEKSQCHWLIGKVAAEIPHPPIKYHDDNVWNNALVLGFKKNTIDKF